MINIPLPEVEPETLVNQVEDLCNRFGIFIHNYLPEETELFFQLTKTKMKSTTIFPGDSLRM